MSSAASEVRPEVFGACPLPQSQYERVLLGHGSGGTLTNDLIRKLFVPVFGDEVLAALEDQATLSISAEGKVLSAESEEGGRVSTWLNVSDQLSTQHSALSTTTRIAFTTDAFVVRPIFFPGGDVGRL